MTRNVGIIVLLALFGAPGASADIFTDYTINFTGTGTLPTAGSFTYDLTNPHFSSFLITWEGITFDLTSSANAPASSPTLPGCIDGAADAEASFDLLSGDCQGTPANPAWGGIALSSGGEFRFSAIESAPPFQRLEVFSTVVGNFAADGASGPWTISAAVAPVPEPTSAILMATVLAIAFMARKRFRQRARHDTIE
jgi:hypothetical protein